MTQLLSTRPLEAPNQDLHWVRCGIGMNEDQMRTKQQSTGPTDGGRANRFRKIANHIVFE